MNEQELNKKLAKWAGMKKVDSCQWKIEGHTQYYTPYFTISLDACFKWLVPEIKNFSEIYDNYKYNLTENEQICSFLNFSFVFKKV